MRKYNNSVLGVLGFMDTWLSSDTPGFSLRSRLALQACWSTRILIRSDTLLITNSKRKMSHLHHFYAHEQSDLDRLRQAEIIPSSVQTIQTSLINLNKLRLNVDPKTSNEKKNTTITRRLFNRHKTSNPTSVSGFLQLLLQISDCISLTVFIWSEDKQSTLSLRVADFRVQY